MPDICYASLRRRVYSSVLFCLDVYSWMHSCYVLLNYLSLCWSSFWSLSAYCSPSETGLFQRDGVVFLPIHIL